MSEVLGIGNDIIEIERIRDCLKKHDKRFLERVLTPNEQAYCLTHKDYAPHVAARFSAKEAIAKAFGAGIGELVSWQDIEIVNDEKGKPNVIFSADINKKFSDPKVLISISHCKLYVTCVAIWVR